MVFGRLPFPRTGRGFRVFSVNKISGHLWVKLRRHYPHFALAGMFGISVFTVQNVFVTWINFCYYQWQEINCGQNVELCSATALQISNESFPLPEWLWMLQRSG